MKRSDKSENGLAPKPKFSRIKKDIFESILTVIETEYLSLEATKRIRGNKHREQ